MSASSLSGPSPAREMVRSLRDSPYRLKLDDLAEMTVNEIVYSGTFPHLVAGDSHSEPGRLWTTDAELIPLEQAQAPHEAETLLPVREHGTANSGPGRVLWPALVPGRQWNEPRDEPGQPRVPGSTRDCWRS